VHPLADGMNAWRNQGYPLVAKEEKEKTSAAE
jgi:hypothetical protein